MSERLHVQLIEQAPGPRGSPQDPQPPERASDGPADPPLPTAKTESSFCSFGLRHSGQRGLASPSTNSSKRFSQSRQTYSYSGMGRL
jgi:hypothetical protein